MNSLMRKLIPSGSMTVAVIALLVAMSGSAVAASLITGEQIKDGSVQSKDLSKSARANLAGVGDGVRGPTGPAGPAGPIGPKGARGADGQDGAPGFTQTTVRRGEANVAAHSAGVASAHCLQGEMAVGGGAEFNGADGAIDRIDRTEPATGDEVAPDGATPDGWIVRGFNDENVSQVITAFAVCATTGTD
jgi:hypothetical protein